MPPVTSIAAAAELAAELRAFGQKVLELDEGEAWETPPSSIARVMLWHAAAQLDLIEAYRNSMEVDGDVISAAIEALESPDLR